MPFRVHFCCTTLVADFCSFSSEITTKPSTAFGSWIWQFRNQQQYSPFGTVYTDWNTKNEYYCRRIYATPSECLYHLLSSVDGVFPRQWKRFDHLQSRAVTQATAHAVHHQHPAQQIRRVRNYAQRKMSEKVRYPFGWGTDNSQTVQCRSRTKSSTWHGWKC